MEEINFVGYLKERITHKFFFISLVVYGLLCLGAGIYWCVSFDLRNMLMSFAFIILIPLIFVVEYFVKLRFGELFTLGVLFIAYGSILGSCFNLYSIIPVFDTVLHGTSGLLFTALGFSFAEKFFGKAEGKKKFFGALLFGICFSFSVALLWEFFEYGCTCLLGFDMMEDSLVNNINSYYLAGSHNEAIILDNITHTIIEYDGGKTFVINGYLDLGLIDTMHDCLICALGSIILAILVVIGYFKVPKLNEILIPQAC